jgi:transcription-repair coupling factor (superfamily II helicase)
MQEELIDRYGEMPMQTLALVETHRLRLAGRVLGLAKLDAGPQAIQVQFVKNPPLDPADIILLIQSDRSFKLAGPDKLTWQKPTAALEQRVAAVKDLFRRLKR